MSIRMPKSQDLCEYYFDSQVEKVENSTGTKGNTSVCTPKIYFERNLEKKEMPYRLYAVIEEWLPGYQGDVDFDTVQICYKQGTTNCAEVYASKSNVRNYKQRTNSTDRSVRSVEKDGNILLINEANFIQSGVGSIEMLKSGSNIERGAVSVAKFYFGINCVLRKKIFYTVDISGKNAVINFKCKTAPTNGIKVRLLAHENRLPCLEADRDNCIVEEPIELIFKGEHSSAQVALPANILQSPNRRLYVALEKECEPLFVLSCQHNGTIPEAKRYAPLSPSYTCPFCHGPIDVKLAKTRAYRAGGAACNAHSKQLKGAIGITEANRKKKKRCLICQEDLSGSAIKQDENTHKILPEKFFEHNHFKVAFQGAPRAGKTTYISRFFGLKSTLKQGRENQADEPSSYIFNISMSEMKTLSEKFGVIVEPAPIMAVNSSGQIENAFRWPEKEMQYISRGMQIGRKLPSTPNGDYTKYPFIVEVNNNNYVSFYDIAGEDSRKSGQYIKAIAENDENTIGIFFIVTATNQEGHSVNAEVARRLKEAGENLDPRCPIAVILTKMDAIGDRFDSSCACRRFDYYPRVKDFIYDDSDVEKFINESSEEIKSFIESEGGVDIEQKGKDAADKKRFKNVKYFCVSSFGFADSTYREGDNLDEESYMRFATSTRRMDLPFIWMMRQFGIIK